MTPGSVAQFSTRGKMAPLLTRRRDHTRLSPPGLPVGAAGTVKAVRGAGPARRGPGRVPARVRVSRAARPPDKADNMATSARTSSQQVVRRLAPGPRPNASRASAAVVHQLQVSLQRAEPGARSLPGAEHRPPSRGRARETFNVCSPQLTARRRAGADSPSDRSSMHSKVISNWNGL